VLIQCEVKNLKGFIASTTTSLVLSKKTTTNSKTELLKVNLTNVKTEEASLAQAHQLTEMARDIGTLRPVAEASFDPKLTFDTCT
jgi:hypothetical protein